MLVVVGALTLVFFGINFKTNSKLKVLPAAPKHAVNVSLGKESSVRRTHVFGPIRSSLNCVNNYGITTQTLNTASKFQRLSLFSLHFHD